MTFIFWRSQHAGSGLIFTLHVLQNEGLTNRSVFFPETQCSLMGSEPVLSPLPAQPSLLLSGHQARYQGFTCAVLYF